jgi:hypothetical protein
MTLRRYAALAVGFGVGLMSCSGDDESNEPTNPQGVVSDCFGDCPFGECGSPFTEECATVYPEAVGSSSDYCLMSMTGEYCLVTEDGPSFDYWIVVCENGTPTFEHCTSGCSAYSTPTGAEANCE